MLLFFKTVFSVVTCLAAASCADQSGGLGLGRPNAIIVREFALNQAAVTLDPSFGFSLYRGTPGVPMVLKMLTSVLLLVVLSSITSLQITMAMQNGRSIPNSDIDLELLCFVDGLDTVW